MVCSLAQHVHRKNYGNFIFTPTILLTECEMTFYKYARHTV